MIENISGLTKSSPLRKQAPVPAPSGEASPPQDRVETSAAPAHPEIKPPTLESPAAEKASLQSRGLASTAARVGLGVAMGLTALVGLAQVAHAQPQQAQVQVQTLQQTGGTTLMDAIRAGQPQRDTRPVRVQNVQEAVREFRAERQIYVVGNPQYQGRSFSDAEMARFQEVMQQHPNAYVVLIEQSGNIKNDDYTLARGIGNSEAFKSNVDATTGQPNGAVYMIYFKVTDQSFIQRTGKDRAMFMRSEQLLDDAGVGEGNFVDRETLQNRELFNRYIDSIRGGSDVPTALQSVLQRVDQGVQNYLTNTIQGAQSQVAAARTALDESRSVVGDFQRKHGDRGLLGSPNTQLWRSQLEEAQQKLEQRDYAGAARLAQSVNQAVQQYRQAVANFEGAPAQASEATGWITQAEQELSGLENNGPAQLARQNLESARQALGRYQEAHRNNDPAYQEHLQQARSAAQQATRNVAASKSRTETIKNVKIYGSAALGAAALLTAGILNHGARKRKKEAQSELDKAVEALGTRSKELIRVMNRSDYQEISAYTGMTQKLANELIAGTAEALALMGGGEKAIAEAKSLIVGKTMGERFKNMFLQGNFKQAVELLSDSQEKLPFDLGDSQRVALEPGSRAEGWREAILKNVPAEAMEASFQAILDKLQSRGVGNDGLVSTIQEKSQQVGDYLGQVRGQAQQVEIDSLQLQDQSKEDGHFAAPSVTRRLIPAAIGLLDRGMEVKQQDPLRAWEEFGDVARRMAEEAAHIVGVGRESRQELLPALARADAALHPHQVKTDWAHLQKQELSLDLDRAGEKAVENSVSAAVQSVATRQAELQARLATVVEQDQERREVSPKLIADAEADIETARQGLCQALQAAGVFSGGTPEQVLREPDRDPTTLTEKSHEDLRSIKPRLDNGEIEGAGVHLVNIRQQTASAHQLVKESREAFNNYTQVAEERRERRDQTLGSIPETYNPSLLRIQEAYTESAQKVVAREVHQGLTSSVDIVAQYLQQADEQLEMSGNLNSRAQGNYERAYLLTSRDQLQESDLQLRTAQANLDAIVSAEKALALHQQEAEAELSALQGRLSSTAGKSQESYVRNPAKSLVSQAQTGLTAAAQVVHQKPADPYAAKEALASVENLRSQAETSMASDLRAFNAANSAISSARSAISSAESEISSVSHKSWSTYVSDFGGVSHSVSYSDLSGARSYVDSAERELSSARSALDRQDYEGAERDAKEAQSHARSAESEAERVESREYSHYRSLVAAAEAEAERRRRERERENDNNSGGGGGSSGGGGGSGSTGGGW